LKKSLMVRQAAPIMLTIPPTIRNDLCDSHALENAPTSSLTKRRFMWFVKNGKTKMPRKKTMEKKIEDFLRKMRQNLTICWNMSSVSNFPSILERWFESATHSSWQLWSSSDVSADLTSPRRSTATPIFTRAFLYLSAKWA